MKFAELCKELEAIEKLTINSIIDLNKTNDSCHPSCTPTCGPRCSPSCEPCWPFGRCRPQTGTNHRNIP